MAKIFLLLLFIFVVILGFLWRYLNRVTEPRGGGERLMSAVRGYVTSKKLTPLPGTWSALPVTGGGASKKHWTDYRDWATLAKDTHALAEYHQDRKEAMQNGFKYDWKFLQDAIGRRAEDDKEWACLVKIKNKKTFCN